MRGDYHSTAVKALTLCAIQHSGPLFLTLPTSLLGYGNDDDAGSVSGADEEGEIEGGRWR